MKSGEAWNFCFDISEVKGEGRAGSKRWLICWEVDRPHDIAPIREILRPLVAVLNASPQKAIVRAWLLRVLDRMLGLEMVARFPVLASRPGPPRRILSADIVRDRNGLMVWLRDERLGGGSTLTARVPLASLKLLLDLLDDGRKRS